MSLSHRSLRRVLRRSHLSSVASSPENEKFIGHFKECGKNRLWNHLTVQEIPAGVDVPVETLPLLMDKDLLGTHRGVLAPQSLSSSRQLLVEQASDC